MISRAIAIFLVIFGTAVAAAAQETTTVEIMLEFGQDPVKVESLGNATNVAIDSEKVVTFDTSKNEIKPKALGKDTVKFTKDAALLLTANVTVTPIRVQIAFKAPFTFTDEATPITVLSGDVVEFTVSKTGSNGNPVAVVFPKPMASASFVTAGTDGKITFGDLLQNKGAINPPPTPVTVTFVTPDSIEHTLRFLVVETISSVRVEAPPTLSEKTTTAIPVTILGSNGGIYHSTSTAFSNSYQYDCDMQMETAAKNIVSATRPSAGTIHVTDIDIERAKELKRPLVGTLTCSAQPIGRREKEETSEPKEVKVEASGGSIVFVPPLLNVVAGQAATVRAEVRDRAGAAKPGTTVTWSIVEPTDAAVLTPAAANEASLLTLPDPSKLPPNGVLTIRASTPNPVAGGSPVTADLLVKITSPSGFTRVSGALELLDYQVARDLYGSQTINDFYAAKITLMNDLQDEPDRKLVGASILVFSSSLAIGVNMEKTASDSRRPPRQDATWEPVTFGDLRALGLPVAYPIKSSEARPNFVPPTRDANGRIVHDLEDVPVYSCDDIWFAEQEVMLTPQQELLEKEAREALRAKLIRERDAQVAAARLRQLHYRPYPYDMVVKSFDPRDARSGRSWTFRALAFAGSVTSFLTGVPNFKASNEFIAVNEKFGNVLIPALGALWPSLKETQRQNLVSDTMHPIEEIPYASSLTKVIFLPKYPFQGYKRGYWYRISEVCPFNFQVDVAVAPKDSRTTETVTPQQAGPTRQ